MILALSVCHSMAEV